MTETSILVGMGTRMGRICTSSYPHLYPVNTRIFSQNVDEFRLEMANKPAPVGIARTRPRLNGEF